MFGFRFELLDWLKQPLPAGLTLHTFHVMEPLTVSISISAFFGVVLAAPVICGQLWGFVAQVLYPMEERWVVSFLWLSNHAITNGCMFCCVVVVACPMI